MPVHGTGNSANLSSRLHQPLWFALVGFIDSSKLQTCVGQKKGNWFQRYRLLFLDDLGVEWERGPASLADLEQLNLTRDDLIHNIDMMSFTVERVEKQAERFPTGL